MSITAGQRHQQQPNRHLKRNGYLTYQMTLRKVLRAQQLRINTRVHINWLHACDAGCGRLASSINSALSSSAAVQTWINGAINPSFQMYDFSTSIPSVASRLLVPSPSNLRSTPPVLADPGTAVNCLPFYRSSIWKSVAESDIPDQQEHWRRKKRI